MVIDGFFVYVYSSDPLIHPDTVQIQNLDVWLNMETWVGNLTDGVEYWFTVSAYYQGGKESEKITYVSGIPFDLFPPSKVSYVTTELTDNPYGCKVSWVITYTEDIQIIRIYRSESGHPYDALTITPIYEVQDWRYGVSNWVDKSIENNRPIITVLSRLTRTEMGSQTDSTGQ